MADTPFADFTDATALQATDIGLMLRGSGGMNFPFSLVVHRQSDNRFKAGAGLDVTGSVTGTVAAFSGSGNSSFTTSGASDRLRVINTNTGGGTATITLEGQGAAQRYWAIVNGYDAASELAFRVSNSNDGDPYGAGTSIVRLSPSGLSVVSGTTASAGNVHQASSNSVLLRSTSSERYKRDIEDVDPAFAEAALELRPVFYRSRADADNPDHSHWGFIAEEAARIDPRLVHFGYQDDQYELVEVEPARRAVRATKERAAVPARPAVLERRLKAGAEQRPDGFQYERLGVLHHVVIRQQRDRIAALEAQLAAIEERLAAIEERLA